MVCCQIIDLFCRNTQMIQPLCCDLLTITLFHWLLDIIAWNIGKQAVYPYTDLIFFLCFKLTLAVDSPA